MFSTHPSYHHSDYDKMLIVFFVIRQDLNFLAINTTLPSLVEKQIGCCEKHLITTVIYSMVVDALIR